MRFNQLDKKSPGNTMDKMYTTKLGNIPAKFNRLEIRKKLYNLNVSSFYIPKSARKNRRPAYIYVNFKSENDLILAKKFKITLQNHVLYWLNIEEKICHKCGGIGHLRKHCWKLTNNLIQINKQYVNVNEIAESTKVTKEYYNIMTKKLNDIVQEVTDIKNTSQETSVKHGEQLTKILDQYMTPIMRQLENLENSVNSIRTTIVDIQTITKKEVVKNPSLENAVIVDNIVEVQKDNTTSSTSTTIPMELDEIQSETNNTASTVVEKDLLNDNVKHTKIHKKTQRKKEEESKQGMKRKKKNRKLRKLQPQEESSTDSDRDNDRRKPKSDSPTDLFIFEQASLFYEMNGKDENFEDEIKLAYDKHPDLYKGWITREDLAEHARAVWHLVYKHKIGEETNYQDNYYMEKYMNDIDNREFVAAINNSIAVRLQKDSEIREYQERRKREQDELACKNGW